MARNFRPSVREIHREALQLKTELTPVELVDRIIAIGRRHGYLVTRRGTDEYPELIFDDGPRIYRNTGTGGWDFDASGKG